MWQLNWARTTEGLPNVSDYNTAISMLLTLPERELHILEKRCGSKLSQNGRKVLDYLYIHSPRLVWTFICFRFSSSWRSCDKTTRWSASSSTSWSRTAGCSGPRPTSTSCATCTRKSGTCSPRKLPFLLRGSREETRTLTRTWTDFCRRTNVPPPSLAATTTTTRTTRAKTIQIMATVIRQGPVLPGSGTWRIMWCNLERKK